MPDPFVCTDPALINDALYHADGWRILELSNKKTTVFQHQNGAVVQAKRDFCLWKFSILGQGSTIALKTNTSKLAFQSLNVTEETVFMQVRRLDSNSFPLEMFQAILARNFVRNKAKIDQDRRRILAGTLLLVGLDGGESLVVINNARPGACLGQDAKIVSAQSIVAHPKMQQVVRDPRFLEALAHLGLGTTWLEADHFGLTIRTKVTIKLPASAHKRLPLIRLAHNFHRLHTALCRI